MKIRLLIGSLLLIILIMNSCHYEEGPSLSLHSAKKIIAGHWKVESFTANGVDFMSYIIRNHLEGEWIFYPDNGPGYPEITVNTGNYQYSGDWGTTNKEIYILLRSDSANNVPSDWVITNTYRIIKLRKHDWKLRASKNGITYEIEFKPW